MITIDPEFCKYYMEDAFRDEKAFTTREGKGLSLEQTINSLTETDIDLLMEYAPKLFDTFPESIKVHDVMLKLAMMVEEYRGDINRSKNYNTYLSNKGKGKKIESFKRDIINLYNQMGGHSIGTKDAWELKNKLLKAFNAPEEYLQEKPRIGTKQHIKDYLNGLHLPDKSNVIKEFIKKLT